MSAGKPKRVPGQWVREIGHRAGFDRPFGRQELPGAAQERALQGRRGAGNAADQRLSNKQHQDCDQASGLGLS